MFMVHWQQSFQKLFYVLIIHKKLELNNMKLKKREKILLKYKKTI